MTDESHPSRTPSASPASHGSRPHGGAGEGLPEIDVNERGAEKNGAPQVMNRRLFMQFLAFRSPAPDEAVRTIEDGMKKRGAASVVYHDVNDPKGLAVLTWSEDPAHFVTVVRPVLGSSAAGIELRPELSMLGRTYSTGFEQELAYWLLQRPVETVMNEAHGWAVWYPLRRSGAFARLEAREQGAILREHGTIGRAYGAQDLAHDVRLACHGLDAADNEFVIGLIGKDLYPLSHVVQSMRKTRQTAEFISQMGPFFVGRVATRTRASS